MSDTSPVSLICCDVVGAAAADDTEQQVRTAAFMQGLAQLGWTVGRERHNRKVR